MISEKNLEQRISKQIHLAISKLYKLTREHQIAWLMDWPSIGERLDEWHKNKNIYGVQHINSIIDNLQETTICGEASGKILSLISGEKSKLYSGDRIKGHIKKSPEYFLESNNIEKLKFPIIMRIQIDRKNEQGNYVASHSIAPIIHNENDINLIAAYIDKYSCSEYVSFNYLNIDGTLIKNPRDYVDSLTLKEFMSHLCLLQSPGEDTSDYKKRGEVYTKLFRPAEFSGQKAIRIGHEPININLALSNIIEHIKKIYISIDKYPQAVGNKASIVMRKLYDHQGATLSINKLGVKNLKKALDEIKMNLNHWKKEYLKHNNTSITITQQAIKRQKNPIETNKQTNSKEVTSILERGFFASNKGKIALLSLAAGATLTAYVLHSTHTSNSP